MMLAAILGLLNGIIGWLNSVLPISPFHQFTSDGVVSTVGTALGWLNWVVDVSGMLNIFSAWLSALGIWWIVKWLKKNAIDNASQWIGFLGA